MRRVPAFASDIASILWKPLNAVAISLSGYCQKVVISGGFLIGAEISVQIPLQVIDLLAPVQQIHALFVDHDEEVSRSAAAGPWSLNSEQPKNRSVLSVPLPGINPWTSGGVVKSARGRGLRYRPEPRAISDRGTVVACGWSNVRSCRVEWPVASRLLERRL